MILPESGNYFMVNTPQEREKYQENIQVPVLNPF
jgi:hypothetical protein